MKATLNKLFQTNWIAYLLYALVFIGVPANLLGQAPVNDECANAVEVPIPAGGFGLGNFISASTNLTNATVQAGETYSPAIFVAGLDKKSVWYRFSIPTIRAVRVTLTQPGTTITAGDVGFAVYQTNACLPTNANISTKLTPIVTFGNTYHPCVPAGDYLVQVSSKLAANGPVNIVVDISDQTGAAYDHPIQAYAFGVAANYSRKIDFDTECQSIEDAQEVCTGLFNNKAYHKSAWFTFTTPAYFDYLAVTLSGTGATQYFPGGGANILKKFGYTLYQGNVVTTPYNTLTVRDGCDSMETNGYRAAVRRYTCDQLLPNTTYSIQLFFHKDFSEMLRLGLITGGVAPTAAPLPVTGMPVTNALGVLNASGAGVTNTMFDYFGCNSRHSLTACNPSIPAAGINIAGKNYNLSSFATFTLKGSAAINFRPGMLDCGPRPVIRLFKQPVTGNCADLDTANLVATATYNTEVECLAAGDYVVQVLGTDEPLATTSYYSSTPTYNYNQCLFTNLGSRYRLDMIVYTRKANNKFSLKVPGAFDTVNRVGAVQQPLLSGIAYLSAPDTIGCEPTLRPWDTTCSPLNDKVIYRQFVIADSGTVDFGTLTYSNNPPLRYKLYGGDANALASAQNVFNFPDKVTGIVPKTLCFNGSLYCENKTACVVPGTYTFTTMGSDGDVGRADRPTFTFVKTRTKHNSPFNAHDMGSIMDTLGPGGGTLRSYRDFWSCEDNAISINGYTPCPIGGRPATKAIYRQFYLKDEALVRFSNPGYGGWCVNNAYGTRTLFYGKATDGPDGLTPVGNQWNCFSTARTTNDCTPLAAGWYTVVSYGTGPSYDSTMRLTNVGGRYNGHVSYRDEFDITITPACPGPKYNRPYKASVNSGKQPHLVQWVNRLNSTPAYPRNDTTYILPAESFNCTLDTPFSMHPIKACEPAANRVAYYVFKTTEVCFLQIDAGGFFATVYDKDVRTDSLQFGSAVPIQQCNSRAGFIQFCFFQPGTYTLVVFAKDANSCSSVSPKIYIDQIGYSRFDYAANAYDFGVVPPDNAYHAGKVGEVNPLHGLRAPSNDFFYCTTGAFATDPTNAVCNAVINPNVYNNGPNKPLYDSVIRAGSDIARRNLWYTFVAADAGTVRVKVESKTAGRGLQPRFAVYRSNVDGTLPFTTVKINGEIDSTTTQGLTYIGTNLIHSPYRCYSTPNNISFYRDPCTSVTNRYYVLVENVNGYPAEVGGQLPNTQVEVSVLVDSVSLVLPNFDHYSQAGDIGSVGVGTFTGPTDNFSCATRDAPDPVYNNYGTCQKTLWYKFTATVTGNVRYRIKVNGNISTGYDHVQLFRQSIPGDSTTNGLKIQLYSSVNTPAGTWAQTCVSPGVYYLLLPGCTRVNEFVFPEIELIEAVGDFCNRAIPAVMVGPGAVSATVLVNCHTIATDYGEFGPQLTCPPNASTQAYKSSWFRMDIGGTDTLDVTTFLVENTNAASGDIKYRLMTGDCGAMQEQSCVLDALTQNTYQCLVPGQSYFVQVFTPVLKNGVAVTGTIELKLSSIAHADTCAPLSNCLASANFNTVFDCNKNDSVKFVNFSTYGTSISYQWDFGYNGQTSTEVSPSFFYPALPTDRTYTIKLVVFNSSCLKKDSVTRTIFIPGRPSVNLGADIAQCNSTSPVRLTATSHTGATYLWQNNSTADSFRVSTTGRNNYWVNVNYNGCSSRDTINVVISPISAKPLQQIILCTDSVEVDVRRGFGETYRWSTGATSRSVYMSAPGFYWVDIAYLGCIYRDSFEVNNVTAANPLGNDTTLCLSGKGYLLNANITGAKTYTWQNNSTADTFLVTLPGEYRVAINFGNCIIRDTVNIFGEPLPLIKITDTSICAGESLFLPWSVEVSEPGIYTDTVRYLSGCDSLVQRVNLTIKPKPDIGRDTVICSGEATYLVNATMPGAMSYSWQDGTTTPTYTIRSSGEYWVYIDYGNCVVSDSIKVGLASKAITINKDTSICLGSTLQLPWGLVVQDAGVYIDTIRTAIGCDSLIRIYQVKISTQPVLGNDIAAGICNGNAVNLTSYFNTSSLNSVWTLNNNPVPSPSSVSTAGTYTLIAGNVFGCYDTAKVVVTVNTKPNLGNDTSLSICQGTSTSFTNVYNTTGLTANWTVNGTALANPAMVMQQGTYRLIVANSVSCSDTALIMLSVNPKPLLPNDTAISICQGNTFSLATVYSDNTPGNWTNAGLPVTNPSMVSNAGTYRLISTTLAGCSDTILVNLSLSPKPLLVTTNPARLCIPQTANLTLASITAGSTAGLTFTYWQDSAATTVLANASVAGVGTYFIKGTSGVGCFDSKRITVTAYPLPVINAGNDISICNQDSLATLQVTVTNTTAPVSYQWQSAVAGGIINPGSAATVVKPSTTPQAYMITVSDGYGCNYRIRDTVLVNRQPAVPAFAGNDTIAVTGVPQQLLAMGGSSYLWSPAGLLNNANVPNPMAIIYGDSVLFSVIVQDDKGCKGYDSVWVRAYNGTTYYVPNAFSPNGDAKNDIFRPIPVGIESTELFRVFNRYGDLLFETTQWMKGWDGTYKGKPQPIGNYIWVIKGKGRNGRIIEMKGNVLLIR